MKKTTVLLATITATALLAGCASSGTPTGDRRYSEDNSRAYNLAHAGGLREARDTELGAEDYSNMMSSLGGGARTALSLSNSSGFGLSGGASLGLGVASALLSGPGMMGRDSAFAFVPSNEATSPEDATKVIRDHFYNGVHEAAENSGFTVFVNEPELDFAYSRQRNAMALYLINEDMGCPMPTEQHRGNQVCLLGLGTPHQAGPLNETPIVAQETAGAYSYPYSAVDHTKSLLVTMSFSDEATNLLGVEQAELNRLALISELSQAMPSWFYIYLSGRDYTPPMIIENGNAELFVTRK